MLRGLYTAAAGMITQQRRHDTVTQNIANINTMGYKQVNTAARSFPEVLVSITGGDSSINDRKVGTLNTGVFMEEGISMLKQGEVMESNKPTDIAIVSDLNVTNPETGQPMVFDSNGEYMDEEGNVTYKPQAFFTLQDANGQTRYTRGGSFAVNSEGQLLSSNGLLVMDTDNEPITINGSVENLIIDGQGRIVNTTTEEVEEQFIAISIVNQPHKMVSAGNGVFQIDDTDAAGVRLSVEDDNFAIRQGYLEYSNVDSAQSMVDMNLAARAYEANQKVIQFYDRSLDKAVNEIGRV
ncbi:Flagellar basal-body rod protein FlgG [compost metagenome]